LPVTLSTHVYPLSLHDALPISIGVGAAGLAIGDEADVEVSLEVVRGGQGTEGFQEPAALLGRLRRGRGRLRRLTRSGGRDRLGGDRKSTRLNSSHLVISYAVFC